MACWKEQHVVRPNQEYSLPMLLSLYGSRVTASQLHAVSTYLYLLVVSSSPPLVFVCSQGTAGTAGGGRSRSLYLPSSAVAAVVSTAGVTVCSPAPWDLVPTTCSGQGPAEQPRTTMALGKCLQKMGLTCLRVSGLRQKSCRV